jgi:hypothetical protein
MPTAQRGAIMRPLLVYLSALLSACAAAAPASPPDASPAADATRCADDPACIARTCAYEHYACGTFHDVGGDAFDCGACIGAAECIEHACTIVADAREDNDDATRATWLGALDDLDDAYLRLADLTIDSRTDQDWFQFHVADAFDGGNPRISVALDAAVAHELVVWFHCDALDAATIAFCGESQNAVYDPVLGVGCFQWALATTPTPLIGRPTLAHASRAPVQPKSAKTTGLMATALVPISARPSQNASTTPVPAV